MGIEFDRSGSLWPDDSSQRFCTDVLLTHLRQVGGSCVSTGLAQITGEAPQEIRARLNTQSPSTWSDALGPFGWKLAYCNTDFRRLVHYRDELIRLNDLFVLCTYSPSEAQDIGGEPGEGGMICGSHFFLLHGDQVFDTNLDTVVALQEYPGLYRYTKRIFRVVPVGYPRGV